MYVYYNTGLCASKAFEMQAADLISNKLNDYCAYWSRISGRGPKSEVYVC
jgi:hypothetical protein